MLSIHTRYGSSCPLTARLLTRLSADEKFRSVREIGEQGDVNDDGVVDVADIASVINIMAANARMKQTMDAE